jgi:hypothetical protein
VAQEKLDLLEFATRQVTQSRTGAAKVVRCQVLDAGACRRNPDDVPKHLRRHPAAPDPSGLVDGAEHRALSDGGGRCPGVDRGFDPPRDRHGPDVTALADQIGYDPVFFSLLDGLQRERQQFASAQATADEHGEHRMVAQRARRGWLRVFQQPPALLGRQPVPEPDPETPNALHAPDAGGQFGAQETRIRRLVGDPANGREPQVDGGRCILPLLEVNSIAENDGAVERETWLRAVPRDELPNRVIVGALAAPRGQAAEDR